MSSSFEFLLRPAPAERVEVALTLPPSDEAVLCGVVTRADGSPAVCSLITVEDAETRTPLMHTLADTDGHFLLGPIPPNELYYINVYDSATDVRSVQIQL